MEISHNTSAQKPNYGEFLTLVKLGTKDNEKLIASLQFQGCKTCVCDDAIYVMTEGLDLIRYDPVMRTLIPIPIWKTDKPSPKKNFILASNGILLYYVGETIAVPNPKGSDGQILFINPRKAHIFETYNMDVASARLWAASYEKKSGYIQIKADFWELTSTNIVMWHSQKKFERADAYFIMTCDTDIPNLPSPSKSKTFHVFLSFKNNVAFLYQPNDAYRIPALNAEAQMEEIPDLPKTRYVLQYYNWVLIVGVQENGPKIRVWATDFEQEVRYAIKKPEYAIRWREWEISGEVPNLEAVHAVNLLGTSIDILASAPTPGMFRINLPMLNQVPIPKYAQAELAKKNLIAKKEYEQVMHQATQNQLMDAQDALKQLRLEVRDLKNQNETLSKSVQYEKSVAKDELRDLKEEVKKLRKEIDTMKNLKEKTEQTMTELKSSFNVEKLEWQKTVEILKEEHKKEIAALKAETEQIKGNNLVPLNEQQLRDLKRDLKNALFKIKNELDDRAESSNCLICTERPRNMVFTPCHHMCICEQCANTIKDIKCPVCRAAGEVFKVYL